MDAMTESKAHTSAPPRSYDLSCDDRGRVTIPKALREDYGTEYRIREEDGYLTLHPVSNGSDVEYTDGTPSRTHDISCDAKGRPTIPSSVRFRYGGEYRLAEQEGHLVLYPLSQEENA